MARSATSGVETACPNCGHGPIASGEERCPKCYVAFRRGLGMVRNADREIAPLDAAGDGTRIGGLDLLTSDAEAHPGTMAAALAALGLFASAAALGAMPMPGEPGGYLVLAAANLLLAGLLLQVPAFARPLVIISAPVQVAGWLWLGRTMLPNAPTVLAVATMPLLILAGVTGATGPRRRSGVLAATLAAVCYAATVQIAERRGPPVRLDAPVAGLHLELPAGYRPLHQPEELTAYLPIPAIDARVPSFAFADPVRDVAGFWSVAAPGRIAAGRLAQAVAAQLDGDRGIARLVRDDLQAHASLPQTAWEIPLEGGRAASATALRLPDDRTALLVISAPRAALGSARQELGRAASFPRPDDRR